MRVPRPQPVSNEQAKRAVRKAVSKTTRATQFRVVSRRRTICCEPGCATKPPDELKYCCGGSRNPEVGCGKRFCDRHLYDSMKARHPSVCAECLSKSGSL